MKVSKPEQQACQPLKTGFIGASGNRHALREVDLLLACWVGNSWDLKWLDPSYREQARSHSGNAFQCGRFYVAGEPCNLKFGWYSLWFFMRANATRQSLRARMTKAWVLARPLAR